MNSIIYCLGNAAHPLYKGPKIIAHVCNDNGGWGKGFVLSLSERSKEPEKAYRRWFASGDDFGLGAVQFVDIGEETEVANIIGQHGTRRKSQWGDSLPPVRYEAIQEGLQKVAQRALERGATVHMPRMGAGLAGGNWEVIASMIKGELCIHDVTVFVYDLEPDLRY